MFSSCVHLSAGGGYRRAEFLRKHQYFKAQGEHCYLKSWNFGTEPDLISFGNNVYIASNVTFINHDVSHAMLNYMDKEHQYEQRRGEIEIGDNVFIGSKSILLYNVKIGSNVIIGAGSIVNRDIPDGSVAAGIPARVVGSFADYQLKLRKENNYEC